MLYIFCVRNTTFLKCSKYSLQAAVVSQVNYSQVDLSVSNLSPALFCSFCYDHNKLSNTDLSILSPGLLKAFDDSQMPQG